jgi:hypothetical protein
MVVTLITSPHIVLLIFNLFFVYGWSFKNENQSKALVAAFTACYFLILYMFTAKTGDHILYKDYYLNGGSTYNANFEPSWRYLNDIMHAYISQSYDTFIVIIYILTLLFKWIAAKLCGGDVYMTFILTIVLLFHVDFEQIRQGLVLSLALVSLGLVLKRKVFMFLVTSVVCVILHYGMIGFFVPVVIALFANYFSTRVNYKFYKITIMLILLFTFLFPLAEFMISLLSKEVFFHQKLYAYYMSQKFSYSTFSTTRIFFLVLCMIFILNRNKFQILGSVKLVLLTDTFICTVVLAQIFSEIGVVATRLYFVFGMGLLCLILPMILAYLKGTQKNTFFMSITFLPNFFLYTFLRSALKYI